MTARGYPRSPATEETAAPLPTDPSTPPGAERTQDMGQGTTLEDRPGKRAEIQPGCRIRFHDLKREKATLNGGEGVVSREHPMNPDLWMVEFLDDTAQKVTKAFNKNTLESLDFVPEPRASLPKAADLVTLDVTELSGQHLCTISAGRADRMCDIRERISNLMQIPFFDLVIGTEVLQGTTAVMELIPDGSESANISLVRLPRDKTLVPQLRRAIGDGDLRAVHDLLRRSSDFDLPDAGAPALHHAVKSAGSDKRRFDPFSENDPLFEIVQALVEHKADVNARDSQNRLALHCAGNSEKIVNILLDARSEVNVECNSGTTPLLKAANAEVLRALLSHKADVNAAGKEGKNALHIFARAANAEVNAASSRGAQLEMLLEAGIDVNAKDSLDQTPLKICKWLHGQNICPDDNEKTRARLLAAGAW